MTDIKQAFEAVTAQLTGPGAPWEFERGDDGIACYKQAPANLVEALSVARQHGDREFLVYEGERRSFNQLLDEADAIAAALQARGVAKGDRVGLAMRNYPEWMAVFIAVVKIGAVIVPVNSWGRPADISHALGDAGVKLAFLDQARYDGIADWLADNGVTAVIARPAAPGDPLGMAAFVAPFSGKAPAPVTIDGDDLALIMYTSGTSGAPKGAASTHRAICQALYNFEFAAAAAAMCNMEAIGAMLERGFESTSLLAVPLFHVSGCHAQFLTNLRAGRRIVMMYKWDVDRALQYIEQERITGIAAAPSMVLDLLESPAFDTADTRSLFSIGIGGAATPPRVGALLKEKMPANFSGTGWGMTETNAQGASLTGDAFERKPGSAGLAHPIVDLRICDEQGAELGAGQTGEIWVRSPCNIREYWHRPEANASDFRDGWLRTGDIGYLDPDGFLYLADRAKDMIIRGGENIYPAEIENQLLELPAVKEVAALGLPHERWGEEVAVVVQLQPGQSLDEAQLLEFARARLAPYKVPTRVFFSDQPLPRNATNKVLKRELKERLLA
ncbi:MAG: AMP-binding protein [Gammaproteobacteria bacterium]|jgi:long-chain acyl-CoA synthetase|nr:AMP-binding protein [Gammaproteobacteria bacterium]